MKLKLDLHDIFNRGTEIEHVQRLTRITARRQRSWMRALGCLYSLTYFGL